MLTMEELFVIHQLREQGESITTIAKRTGLDRKTVRKYLRRGLERPKYGPRAPRPRVIDPYRDYLRERLSQHPKLSAMRLLREIRELGYSGGRTAVTDFVATIRPREASCCFPHSPVGPPRELTALYRRRIAWEDGAIQEPTGAGAVAFLMNRRCRSSEDVGARASSVGKRWASASFSRACPHAP